MHVVGTDVRKLVAPEERQQAVLFGAVAVEGDAGVGRERPGRVSRKDYTPRYTPPPAPFLFHADDGDSNHPRASPVLPPPTRDAPLRAHRQSISPSQSACGAALLAAATASVTCEEVPPQHPPTLSPNPTAPPPKPRPPSPAPLEYMAVGQSPHPRRDRVDILEVRSRYSSLLAPSYHPLYSPPWLSRTPPSSSHAVDPLPLSPMPSIGTQTASPPSSSSPSPAPSDRSTSPPAEVSVTPPPPQPPRPPPPPITITTEEEENVLALPSPSLPKSPRTPSLRRSRSESRTSRTSRASSVVRWDSELLNTLDETRHDYFSDTTPNTARRLEVTVVKQPSHPPPQSSSPTTTPLPPPVLRITTTNLPVLKAEVPMVAALCAHNTPSFLWVGEVRVRTALLPSPSHRILAVTPSHLLLGMPASGVLVRCVDLADVLGVAPERGDVVVRYANSDDLLITPVRCIAVGERQGPPNADSRSSDVICALQHLLPTGAPTAPLNGSASRTKEDESSPTPHPRPTLPEVQSGGQSGEESPLVNEVAGRVEVSDEARGECEPPRPRGLSYAMTATSEASTALPLPPIPFQSIPYQYQPALVTLYTKGQPCILWLGECLLHTEHGSPYVVVTLVTDEALVFLTPIQGGVQAGLFFKSIVEIEVGPTTIAFIYSMDDDEGVVVITPSKSHHPLLQVLEKVHPFVITHVKEGELRAPTALPAARVSVRISRGEDESTYHLFPDCDTGGGAGGPLPVQTTPSATSTPSQPFLPLTKVRCTVRHRIAHLYNHGQPAIVWAGVVTCQGWSSLSTVLLLTTNALYLVSDTEKRYIELTSDVCITYCLDNWFRISGGSPPVLFQPLDSPIASSSRELHEALHSLLLSSSAAFRLTKGPDVSSCGPLAIATTAPVDELPPVPCFPPPSPPEPPSLAPAPLPPPSLPVVQPSVRPEPSSGLLDVEPQKTVPLGHSPVTYHREKGGSFFSRGSEQGAGASEGFLSVPDARPAMGYFDRTDSQLTPITESDFPYDRCHSFRNLVVPASPVSLDASGSDDTFRDPITGLPYLRSSELNGEVRVAIGPLYADAQPQILWAEAITVKTKKMRHRVLVVTPEALYIGAGCIMVRYIPFSLVSKVIVSGCSIAIVVPSQFDILFDTSSQLSSATLLRILKLVVPVATGKDLVVNLKQDIPPGQLNLIKPINWKPPTPAPIGTVKQRL